LENRRTIAAPEGRMSIAQRLIAGCRRRRPQVPEGRLSGAMFSRPSGTVRGSGWKPSVETLGYFHHVPPGRRRRRFCHGPPHLVPGPGKLRFASRGGSLVCRSIDDGGAIEIVRFDARVRAHASLLSKVRVRMNSSRGRQPADPRGDSESGGRRRVNGLAPGARIRGSATSHRACAGCSGSSIPYARTSTHEINGIEALAVPIA
jgi:hypothetical protein